MRRPLKNPGDLPPKLLDFEEIPSVREFLRHGGVPGCEYLYVAVANQANAADEGWTQIVGVPFFRIRGIGAALMVRGTPLKDTPAQPGTSRCLVSADKTLLLAVSPQTPAEAPKASPVPRPAGTADKLLTP